MAKAVIETDDKYYKLFNFKKISDATGIQPDKLYNKLKKHYDSWNDEDRKKIADVISPAVKKLFDQLGFDFILTRKKK